MKITRIEIYQSPVKLKEPFIISLGPLERAENVIVIVRTDEGHRGVGECSPFPTIQGESMGSCFIAGQKLARALHGSDPLDIEACTLAMDATIDGNASIKSAFDMALFDIAAQNAHLPLFRFLGGDDKKIMVTDYTVSLGAPEKMAQEALKIKSNGFQVIKVKLGESKEKDVTRIRMIREAVGPDIPLRIDANQGWNTRVAIQTLTELAHYNIQFCEEPIPRWNFSELSAVRRQSPIPVMADESCCDPSDAKKLIDHSSCDLFNIKLGKSAGIYKAGKIIAMAEQSGIGMQVGGFLESRLGFTAAAHLALTSDHITYFDFDPPLMFVEDPVTGGITYDSKGVVTVPETPGLGASVDEKYLQGLTKAVIY